MLRQGPIPLLAHAAAEPVLAALLIAAPFLFRFNDDGAPTAVSIIAGLGVLVLAMSTCWRLSLVKVVPISAHMVLDLCLAALLIAAPFLFGFRATTAPTVFFIALGVVHLLAVLGTRWERGPAGASGTTRRGRGPARA
jgi:hypothetical protein